MRLRRTARVARMFAHMLGRVPLRHLWYLARCMRYEKPHRFAGHVRINTFFPPYPSPAFDRFCDAVIARRRVPHSTYFAVTDRCPYTCAHCSYANRAGRPLSPAQVLDTIAQIKALGTCILGLTGGEPLLRADLETLIAAAGPEMSTVLFTTGHGLDATRARRLADAGIGCVTIGLESAGAATHDEIRAMPGSFEEAATAARVCRDANIYLAISTIGTRDRIAGGELERLYALAEEWGCGEFRILTPVATGAWLGCQTPMLSAAERTALAEFHRSHNRRATGPAVAAFAHLESDEVFGCGGGFHHLFIDAAGNACPCDLTPLSFGNVAAEPLADVWKRMGTYFPRPRRGCLMQTIAGDVAAHGGLLPLAPAASERLCGACLPQGRLPEAYRRLVRPGEAFKDPE